MISPKTINLSTLPEFKPRDLLRKSVNRADGNIVVEKNCLISIDGVPSIAFLPMEEETGWYLTNVLKKIEYQKSKRSSGLKTHSRIFGYRPPNSFRRVYSANVCSIEREFPKEHRLIFRMAEKVCSLYQKAFPTHFDDHKKNMQSVHADWTIENTVFTSGIINKDNPLKYHFDTGNFRNLMSAMIVNSKNIFGGELVLPSLNARLALEDNTVVFFDGQSILHGVAPFHFLNGDGYRYTTVFYSLQGFVGCGSREEELIKARQKEWQVIS